MVPRDATLDWLADSRRKGCECSSVELEYFVAVAEERHSAGRPRSATYPSPRCPRRSPSWRRELNVTLINRGHSFEGLTPEGERLVVWAKRILAEHDAFKAEVDAVRSGITGTLRLGTVPTASTTASLVLSAFCSAHSSVKVQIRSRLAADRTVPADGRLRNCDAVMVHATPDDGHEVDLVPLYEEHYVLLAPADMLLGASTLGCRCRAAAAGAADRRHARRQMIDRAFAGHSISVTPQVEPIGSFRDFAQAATGNSGRHRSTAPGLRTNYR